MNLYQAIANNARLLADKQGPHYDAASERLKRICDALPSGCGFDRGTYLAHSDDSKIVLKTHFHHMNENGFYDGWTDHKVTIRASLSLGITVHVGGRNRNDIKDYIADVFSAAMDEEFEWIKE